jgi:NADP-dependent 3-hydroxy acid dehydrogenase YdfG
VASSHKVGSRTVLVTDASSGIAAACAARPARGGRLPDRFRDRVYERIMLGG